MELSGDPAVSIFVTIHPGSPGQNGGIPVNPYLLVLILVAAVSAAGLAGAGGIRRAREDSRITARKVGSMSRDEMYRILARVEKLEEPELVMGAMCYEPVAMPYILEYVCPSCGEKTDYGYDSDTFYSIQCISESRSIMMELDSLSELEMTLDESSFCSFCRSDTAQEPSLILRTTWDDGSTHSAAVTVEDLRMLSGLLSGRLDYSTTNDGTLPLKPQIERLRELLGI